MTFFLSYMSLEKLIRQAKRILLASLAAAVSAPIFAWLLSELVVYYELFSTGAQSWAELSNDLGLGILLVMVVPLGTLVGSVSVWFVVWLRTRKAFAASSSVGVVH